MDRVTSLLANSDSPLSTNEIANELEIDWHTARRRLDERVKEGKLFRSEVSNRLTLYWDREIPF